MIDDILFALILLAVVVFYYLADPYMARFRISWVLWRLGARRLSARIYSLAEEPPK